MNVAQKVLIIPQVKRCGSCKYPFNVFQISSNSKINEHWFVNLVTLQGERKSIVNSSYQVQKQSRKVFCKKSCSQKLRRIHRKTPMLESLFNKVADLKACNLIKIRLQHSCFPMNFAKFSRAPYLQNTYGQVLQQTSKIRSEELTHFSSIFPFYTS